MNKKKMIKTAAVGFGIVLLLLSMFVGDTLGSLIWLICIFLALAAHLITVTPPEPLPIEQGQVFEAVQQTQQPPQPIQRSTDTTEEQRKQLELGKLQQIKELEKAKAEYEAKIAQMKAKPRRGKVVSGVTVDKIQQKYEPEQGEYEEDVAPEPPKPVKIPCPICGKAFRNQTDFSRHIQYKHPIQ